MRWASQAATALRVPGEHAEQAASQQPATVATTAPARLLNMAIPRDVPANKTTRGEGFVAAGRLIPQSRAHCGRAR